MDKRVKIFDTTLRDGTQSPDVNLTISDKLELVKALEDKFGVTASAPVAAMGMMNMAAGAAGMAMADGGEAEAQPQAIPFRQ